MSWALRNSHVNATLRGHQGGSAEVLSNMRTIGLLFRALYVTREFIGGIANIILGVGLKSA